jgi:hypothetical protein
VDVASTAKHVAQSQGDEFVCRQAAGLLALKQDGRQLVLGAGDVTLLNPLLPYSARFSAGSKLLVAKVPRRELAARIGKTREMIAIAPEAVRGRTSLDVVLPGDAARCRR